VPLRICKALKVHVGASVLVPLSECDRTLPILGLVTSNASLARGGSDVPSIGFVLPAILLLSVITVLKAFAKGHLLINDALFELTKIDDSFNASLDELWGYGTRADEKPIHGTKQWASERSERSKL
jgi:hypothetical protein